MVAPNRHQFRVYMRPQIHKSRKSPMTNRRELNALNHRPTVHWFVVLLAQLNLGIKHEH